MEQKEVTIPIGDGHINGTLTLIPDSIALVIFAHGSGSSRFSKRNQFVADILHQEAIATFLFDLLTQKEDEIDQMTREFRFDIPLLAERLVIVTNWVKTNKKTEYLKLGYFGSSTGAAAALIAAAQLPKDIKAVVSRGGRPDLAMDYLPQVQAPTLLIVGELDYEVIKLNEDAYAQLNCTKELQIIPNATHLFQEPGTLQEAANVAMQWIEKYLH